MRALTYFLIPLLALALLTACQKDVIAPRKQAPKYNREANIAFLEFLTDHKAKFPNAGYIGRTYAPRERWGEDHALRFRATAPLRELEYRMPIKDLYDHVIAEIRAEGVDPTVFNPVYSAAVQTLAYYVAHAAGVQQGGLATHPELVIECLEWLHVQRAVDMTPYAEVLRALADHLPQAQFDKHRNYVVTKATQIKAECTAQYDRRHQDYAKVKGDYEAELNMMAEMQMGGRSYLSATRALELFGQ